MSNISKALPINNEQKKDLQLLVSNGNTPQKISLRSQAILLAWDGLATIKIAKDLKVSRPSIISWRQRFLKSGIDGLLKDAPRPGRKKEISDKKVKAVLEATLLSKPESAPHWSTRSMAKKSGKLTSRLQNAWVCDVDTFNLVTYLHFLSAVSRKGIWTSRNGCMCKWIGRTWRLRADRFLCLIF